MRHLTFEIIAMLFILVLSAGIFVLREERPVELKNIVFTPSVKGCAEKIQELQVRGVGKEEPPTINVTDRSILYYRAISHQCCKMVELTKEIGLEKIVIYENWTGEGCRCICYSEISAKIDNLEPGTYMVYVIKKEANQPDLQIISKQVTIY